MWSSGPSPGAKNVYGEVVYGRQCLESLRGAGNLELSLGTGSGDGIRYCHVAD
jgi:hypothetical protein